MTIFRTRIKNEIVAEVAMPARRSRWGEKVLILCGGFPSMPGKHSVMEFFAGKGWWVINPRYRGTWESGGDLFRNSPVKDITDVLDVVARGKLVDVWSGKRYGLVPQQFALLGGSFGGAAALLASPDKRISKVVVLSPVVDWIVRSKGEPLDWLYHVIKRAFGEAFRVSKKDWNKLKGGNFFNPMRNADKIDGRKILIFHTKDDDVVAWRPVRRFAEKTRATLKLRRFGGHLSLSHAIEPVFFKAILGFLRT